MKTIAWILVIWVVGSIIYSYKTGDGVEGFENFLSAIKQEIRNHPIAGTIIIIIVGIILLKILF